MRARPRVLTIAGMAVCCLAALTLPACNGGPDTQPRLANVTVGTMPADATWDGVYYSPLFGYLHLKREGNLVKGRWERPLKDKWGEITGNVSGNVLRFDWTEFVTGLVGPNSSRSGKGYFVYSRPEGENVDDVIEGERGKGNDEVGMEWKAVKQRNREADLESIGGTTSRQVGGGTWDSENTEPGEPEAPVPPPVPAADPEL